MAEGFSLGGGVVVTVDARDLIDEARVFQQLGDGDLVNMALSRALNWTMDRTYTQVARGLAKQTGLAYSAVPKSLEKRYASAGNLEAQIVGTGKFHSLADFGPTQRKKGVSAKPWNVRRTFPGTFMGPNGQVYKRLGRSRLPIEKLWGPSIPREMTRGNVASTFQAVVRERLPARVEHEVGFILRKLGG
ncbi:phage tail protein [Microvirga sp. Mcv34]|uniref:phage tail protein n=1 Tax=Microvirga sp. Mcv34 TaxID=2926016 RepID=UPI0021C9F3C9|nr:phage tail protein [Microvirga sp. Mcv34]